MSMILTEKCPKVHLSPCLKLSIAVKKINNTLQTHKFRSGFKKSTVVCEISIETDPIPRVYFIRKVIFRNLDVE